MSWRTLNWGSLLIQLKIKIQRALQGHLSDLKSTSSFPKSCVSQFWNFLWKNISFFKTDLISQISNSHSLKEIRETSTKNSTLFLTCNDCSVDRITSQLISRLSSEPRPSPPPPVSLGVMYSRFCNHFLSLSEWDFIIHTGFQTLNLSRYDLRAMKKHWEEKVANAMKLSAEKRQIETRKLYDEGSRSLLFSSRTSIV